MANKKRLFGLTVLGSFAAVAALVGGGLAAGGPVHSATGSAQEHIGSAYRTFAFNAKLFADGTASGQAEVQARQLGSTFHLDVNCLEVVGNTAYVSGVFTKSDNPSFPVGSNGAFTVVDNGEGAKSPADMFSRVFQVGALTCHDAKFTPTETAENGNIQVR
jgi:hypothetical protein